MTINVVALSAKLTTALRKFCDGLFQERCIICDVALASDAQLCAKCQMAMRNMPLHCQSCTAKRPLFGAICDNCRQHPPHFEQLFARFAFNKTVRKLILKAKYGNNRGALQLAAKLTAAALPNDFNADYVIAMPLSKKRLAQRGFNQSNFLAQEITKKYAIAQRRDVLRRVHRPAQSSLENDIQKRHQNICGAFRAHQQISGRVLLVDDVLTSGASANEAAQTLLAAGATSVDIAVLAAVVKKANGNLKNNN